MADQSQWFKLWCSAPGDDSIQRLPVALRWAWAALGAHTKRHGTGGVIDLSEDNVVLRAEMCLENGVKIVTVCASLPHIHVDTHSDGTFTVTWHNWKHYQEDSTVRERQAASRQRRRDKQTKNTKTSRPKKRREEKRRENPSVGAPTGSTEAERDPDWHRHRQHAVELTRNGKGQRIWRCWGPPGHKGICAEGEADKI